MTSSEAPIFQPFETLAEKLSQSSGADVRRHMRVEISLPGRVLVQHAGEWPCQVIELSAGGAVVRTEARPSQDDLMIIYIDQLGRFQGRMVRLTADGFAMAFDMTSHKRDKLVEQLTWLVNSEALDLPDNRRHVRVAANIGNLMLFLENGDNYSCVVTDMSLSGAALKTSARPPIGSQISLGQIRARVVRHFDEGLAIEFLSFEDPEQLGFQLPGGKATQTNGMPIPAA